MKHNIKIKFSLLITSLLLGYCGGGEETQLNQELNSMPPTESLNTEKDEFGITFLPENKILFTSNRNGDSELNSDALKNGEDIFICSAENYHWNTPELLGGEINTIKNEGTPVVYPRTNLIVFARTHAEGLGSADLYSGYLIDDEVIEVKNLGSGINSKYWDSHPAISPDGSYLIFSSDRPGGFGGTDLWISSGRNGYWTDPVNMGESINTAGDEYSPNLFDEGGTILCFSSNGRSVSKGQFDIYYTKFIPSSPFFNVFSFDRPINSVANEVFPTYSKKEGKLFFSSDRIEGRGGYDIYSESVEIKFPTNTLSGTIINSNNLLPLKLTAGITLSNFDKTAEDIFTYSSSLDGTFKFFEVPSGVYKINVAAEGFENYYDTITVGRNISDLNLMIVPLSRLDENINLTNRITLKSFDLSEYGIPIFVSGYYKPNTESNLIELKNKLKGILKNAGYIENPGIKYEKNTKLVEGIFERIISGYIIDSALAQIISDYNSILEIRISGFSDPRSLRGIYYDEPIIFGGRVLLDNGDKLNNNLLSSLRAYFTKKYLENILLKNDKFRRLKNDNKIIFGVYGQGIYSNAERVDVKRTVKVEIIKRF